MEQHCPISVMFGDKFMIVYVGMYSTTIYPFNKQLVWDSLNPVSVGEDVNV